MSIRQEFASLPQGPVVWRKFGLLVGGVFLGLAALGWWLDAWWSVWVLAVGAPLVVLGALLPRALAPVYRGWMFLAVVLGFIVTRVILSVFFFLVITPVALCFRLIGRDALRRSFDREASSYWLEKEYLIADRTRFEKFF